MRPCYFKTCRPLFLIILSFKANTVTEEAQGGQFNLEL